MLRLNEFEGHLRLLNGPAGSKAISTHPTRKMDPRKGRRLRQVARLAALRTGRGLVPSPRGGIPFAVSDRGPAPHPSPPAKVCPSIAGLANSTRGFRPQPPSSPVHEYISLLPFRGEGPAERISEVSGVSERASRDECVRPSEKFMGKAEFSALLEQKRRHPGHPGGETSMERSRLLPQGKAQAPKDFQRGRPRPFRRSVPIRGEGRLTNFMFVTS